MGRLIFLKDGNIEEEIFSDENIHYYAPKADELVSKDYTTILSYKNILDIDIAKHFSNEDYINLKQALSNYNESELDEMKITNHIIRNGLEDYDVYDYSYIKFIMEKNKDKYIEEYNNLLEKKKPINVLDIYVRQKLNKLTSEEQYMYSKYSEFDLDFLLFSENSSLLTINTDNSGFISIFDDCTYKNTNTTDNHYDTKEKHEEWYRNSHGKDLENVILIYVYKETIGIFVPIDINDYQRNELSNTILELDNLCSFHNKDIIIEAGIIDSDGTALETYSNLSQIKDKFVTKNKNNSKN